MAKRYVYCAGAGAPAAPFIMASNHISHFDPPLLAAALPFHIHFMADAPLFSGKLGNWYFRWMDTFPVDRTRQDTASVRQAVDRLKRGRIVGMFPEGGIRDGERSVLQGGEMKPGAATLALMADVPIIPVVVIGTDRLYNKRVWRRFRSINIWVGIGNPVTISKIGSSKAEARRQGECLLRLQFTELCRDMRKKFGITDRDMPQPPQARMREH